MRRREIVIGMPSPALLVALLALVVALGGTGYAASRIAAEPAKAKKKRRPRRPAPVPKGLTKPEVKAMVDAAVKKLAAVPGPPGPTGPQGPAGPGAPNGPAGGDLAGSYPAPTIAPPEAPYAVAVAMNQQTDPCAAGATSIFCGSTGTPTWSDAGGTGYWKDREGLVHLRGSVATASAAGKTSTIFVLPVGYRPPSTLTFPSEAHQTGNMWGFGVVSVAASGQIVYVDGPAPAAEVLLSGITFRTDR